jgi:antitoxin (DNA-binding transcriptional repressor) of toxin-antitoxin stability system
MANLYNTTQTIKASEARQQWSSLLKKVYRDKIRILVEKSDIPIAGIVPAEQLRLFDEWQAAREKRFAILDEMQAAFSDVPDAEIEEQVQKALSEVRAEMRKEKEHKEN